jgi:hypothetical protein
VALRLKFPQTKRYQQIVHEYMREHQMEKVDLGEVARWAIRTGRYQRKPPTLEQLCQRDLSRACRDEYYTDPQGRAVRVMHPARTEQGVLWSDIRIAQPGHMRISLQQRRQAILHDCRQHKADADSYNDNNVYQTKLPLFDYDFNKDLEELGFPTEYPEAKPDGDDEEDY